MLTIEGLIAVLALCMTAFGLGYMMGNNDKTQKQPPCSAKVRRLFLFNHLNGLTVYRQFPEGICYEQMPFFFYLDNISILLKSQWI